MSRRFSSLRFSRYPNSYDPLLAECCVEKMLDKKKKEKGEGLSPR